MSFVSSSPPEARKCKCGVPMAKLTSWTRENPGRKFISCKFYDPITETRGCKAFEWVDQPDGTDWQTGVINNLLLDKKLLKGEVNELKREVDEISGQRRCLLNEVDNLKMRCKALNADRKRMNRECNEGRVSSISCFGWVGMAICIGLSMGVIFLMARGV
ncbi:uncharacterized protein LOC110719886 [Chenopodium quinoa]|uniref:uncharacterized protein LOC110719886 n=1 Tax=Chenopodium quinoa TaxID=63459 RepID=UPI000B76E846|nr:uncharacterized protein LOC110719886 [Chenopodium quinoa]